MQFQLENFYSENWKWLESDQEVIILWIKILLIFLSHKILELLKYLTAPI